MINSMTLEQANPKSGELWLVTYECRLDAARVYQFSKSCLVIGYEYAIPLEAIQEWHHKLIKE